MTTKPASTGDDVDYLSLGFAFSSARHNNQWHLNNEKGGLDLNLAEVWPDYTGAGVTVAVYDNGVQATHPSLDGNYNAQLEVNNGNDAAPETYDFHGTAVAGIIAGEANALKAPVGVAYDATIVGVDIWDQNPVWETRNDGTMFIAPNKEGDVSVSNGNFSRSTLFREKFDIVNQSFEFLPFEATGNATAVYNNIANAAENGRDGRGTIVVTAAGNDRAANTAAGDNSEENADTNAALLLNDRHSVVVAGVDAKGEVNPESNPGASVLTSAFHLDIGTTDLVGSDGYNAAGDSTRFPGTSAAAPQVSGVVALMLEANPYLGWRDVQTILANTSRHVGSDMDAGPSKFEKDTWEYNGADNWNGGGLHFSNDYGFGLVDARAAVRLAESWTEVSTSANEQMYGARSFAKDLDGNGDQRDNIGAYLERKFIVPQDLDIEKIEVTIDINHPRMSDLVIKLISPEGTASTLLNRALQGGGDEALNRTWTLTSNEFWGEMSRGPWTLQIWDAQDDANVMDEGSVGLVTLRTFGAGDTENDTYIYTDDFAPIMLDRGAHGDWSRQHLSDTDGGVDTINAAAVSSRVRLDLSGESLNWIDWNFFDIAPGSQIEFAFGGDGNDDILGNELGNQLRGNRGSDFLVGRGDFDVLMGGDGDDILAGGAGPDILEGGRGYDFASYFDATEGVAVSLADYNEVGTGDADGDQFQSIEGLIGSAHADRLFGDANVNDLRGGDGADDLDGGGRADIMRGGKGDDEYTVDDDGDIVEELADEGTEDTVYAKTADYQLGANVENLVYLGSLDQPFHGTGNDEANFIVSMGGNDILDGGANNDELIAFNPFMTGVNSGRDTLIGGAGNDHMTGGDDVDTYVFADGWGNDVIGDFAVGEDVLDLRQVSGLNRGLLKFESDDNNGNAKISYNGNSITLAGVTESEARNATFLFDTAHIVGTDDAEEFIADTSANVIEGRGGNDRFHAAYSSNPADIDVMDGGEGIDTVDYSSSDTAMWVSLAYNGKEVWTQDAADLAGTNWREVADLNGIENVVGSRASDRIYGDDGANVLDGHTGNDAVYGLGGDDTLKVAYDNGFLDTLDGGSGTDTLDLSSLDTAMWIGLDYAGREVWTQDTDNVDGFNWREVADLVSIENVVGTNGSDYIAGDAGNNVLHGGAGNDQMYTHDGSDKVYGDAGDDMIESGAGWSELYGGDDDDTLIGGSVYDLMDGGAGDDTITGTGGQTSMFGGDGDDTLTGSLTSNNSMYGGDGNDTVTGGDWTDWFYDAGGDETVHAGGGDDVISDHYGHNFLYGEGGDDWLNSGTNEGALLDGGDGDDTLNAYFGGNTLLGGAGNDLLENTEGGVLASIFTGGEDADTFIYRPGVSVETEVVVTDFQDGIDHIGLRSWLSFDQLTITDTDAGAEINYYGTSTMLLAGVSASQITQDDFLLV